MHKNTHETNHTLIINAKTMKFQRKTGGMKCVSLGDGPISSTTPESVTIMNNVDFLAKKNFCPFKEIIEQVKR